MIQAKESPEDQEHWEWLMAMTAKKQQPIFEAYDGVVDDINRLERAIGAYEDYLRFEGLDPSSVYPADRLPF